MNTIEQLTNIVFIFAFLYFIFGKKKTPSEYVEVKNSNEELRFLVLKKDVKISFTCDNSLLLCYHVSLTFGSGNGDFFSQPFYIPEPHSKERATKFYLNLKKQLESGNTIVFPSV